MLFMGSCNASRICVIPVALLLALLPTTLNAAPINGRKLLEPNPATDWLAAKIRDSIIKRLELTDGQLGSIHGMIDVHRDELLAEVTAVKEARMTLMDQVRAEEFDAEAITEAHARVAETELQLTIHTGIVLQEVRQILTPDQRAEAALLVEELREGAELRFDDFEEKLSTGALLGKKWRGGAPSTGGFN